MRRSAIAVVAIWIGFAAGAWAQEVPAGIGPAVVAPPRELPLLTPIPGPRAVREVPPLSEAERTPLPERATGRVRKITPPNRALANALPLPDGGTLLRLEVSAPGAEGLRLHFKDLNLGGGRLWIYPAGATRTALEENPSAADGPFTGLGPHGDGELWSRPISGDTAVVEMTLPVNPANLPFRIEEIVQVEPERASTAPCQQDVSCYSAFSQAATAVGSYDVVKDGYSYVCSGALVITRSRTFAPYFLTANHCVSTQAHARSVVVYWDFRSNSCNGTVPSRSSRPSTRGSRLLATDSMIGGDYALLLLDEAPPGQRTFLGWSANPIDLGAETVGIHHPGSPPTNFQRITLGTRVADQTSIVSGEEAPAALYWQIRETEGRTEQGSSGSPLMTPQGQVLGVLSHGPVPPPGRTYCDIQGRGAYGRFSAAFPAISQFLNDEQAPGLTVSATSFTFNVADGIASPGTQALEIRNSAASQASFTLSKSASWINLSASNGTATSSSPGRVNISINPALLPASGVVDGIVTVSSGSLAPINVSVRAIVSVTQAAAQISVLPNPVIETQPDADGYSLFYTLRVDETAGVAARITRLVIDGGDRSADIVPFFGTNELPPYGGLGVSLRLNLAALPRRRRIEVSGVTVANNRPWSTFLDVDFLPRPSRARLVMTAAPQEIAQNDNAPNCRWRHDLVIQEEAGYPVELNRWTMGELDLSARLAEFFGSNVLPANGLLRTTLCWQDVGALPRTIAVAIGGRDSGGNAVEGTGSVRMTGITTSSATLSTSVREIDERAQAGGLALLERQFQVRVSSADTIWSIQPLVSGIAKDWITVNPQRGRGPATITVTLDPYFLTSGTYKASLLVSSASTSPQLATVDVQFVAYPPVNGVPRITGVVNGASFATGGLSPGSWITIFGENLAATPSPGRIWSAGEIIGGQLPLALDGTEVRVGGAPAAVYFVSPGQLNVQLPDLPDSDGVPLTVSAGSSTVTTQVRVASVAPALFQVGVTAGGVLPAAIDTSGRLISLPAVIPGSRPARPGEIVSFFGTGFGPTAPAISAGIVPQFAATLANPVTVRIGGLVATVQYAGLTGAGLNQVNVFVPQLPAGNHRVEIEVGGRNVQANVLLPVE